MTPRSVVGKVFEGVEGDGALAYLGVEVAGDSLPLLVGAGVVLAELHHLLSIHLDWVVVLHMADAEVHGVGVVDRHRPLGHVGPGHRPAPLHVVARR